LLTGAPSIREHGLITVFSSETAKAESAARALAEHAGILISATDYARLAAAFQCDLAAFIKFVENDTISTGTAGNGSSGATASTGSAAKAVDTVTKVITVQTVTDLYPLEAKFKQVLLQEDPYVPTDDETVDSEIVSKSNGTVALLQTSAAAAAVDVKSVWSKFAPAVVAAVSLDQFVARSMTLLYDKTSRYCATVTITLSYVKVVLKLSVYKQFLYLRMYSTSQSYIEVRCLQGAYNAVLMSYTLYLALTHLHYCTTLCCIASLSSTSSTTAATTASTTATTTGKAAAAEQKDSQKDMKDKSDVSDDVFDAEGHVVAGLPVQVALRMLFDKLLKGDARRTEVTYSDVVAFAQVRVTKLQYYAIAK
jgi:hypothetical protein